MQLSKICLGRNVQDAPLIRDFDLLVKPGNSVALASASGSGKSTVGNLIAGLSQPWSGTVALAGLAHNGDLLAPDPCSCAFFFDGWPRRFAEALAPWRCLSELPSEVA